MVCAQIDRTDLAHAIHDRLIYSGKIQRMSISIGIFMYSTKSNSQNVEKGQMLVYIGTMYSVPDNLCCSLLDKVFDILLINNRTGLGRG